MVREHNLTFFQRLNLNENKKEVYFLDVEDRKLYIMKKMIYIDLESKETVMDKIFYRDYDLDEIVINLDGSIESDSKDAFKEEERVEYK